MTAARDRSSAGPLALAFAALVGYASLYPFSGWRWPPGLDVGALFWLPWPPWRNRFDIVANVLGYLPLGALVYGACVRNGVRVSRALIASVAVPAMFSFMLEVVQTFLPARVPSRLDWVLNAAGAAVGAAVTAMLHRLGVFDRWQLLRDRWLARRSGGALVLLVLWPDRPPVSGAGPPRAGPGGWPAARTGRRRSRRHALGRRLRNMGDAGHRTRAAVAAGGTRGDRARAPRAMPHRLHGSTARLAPHAARGGRRSARLLRHDTFHGPQLCPRARAGKWLTPVTLPALAVGVVLAALCAPIGRRMAAGLGLVVLTALIGLVAQAPADPYYADSLQAWEQGRFIRFHGLARWVGWLWPYLAMVWLLLNLGGRHRSHS